MSQICFRHLVAWWSPLITQLRTRTNPSVSCYYGFSSDYSHFYPHSACAVKSSLLKLYESVLISRSCETTFSIFHISQMPPSSCVSSKNEAHCSVGTLPVTFGWEGQGVRGQMDGQRTCLTLCLYSDLWPVQPGQVWGAITANLLSKNSPGFSW